LCGFAATAGIPLLSGVVLGQTDPRAQSIAGWRTRIQSILARDRLPIIDVQATYVPGQTNIDKIIAMMNESDVAQIVFATAFAADGSPSIELHRAHPSHVIPASNSGEFPRWWTRPEQFVQVAERDLKTGRYYMMGEHEFRHYPSPEQAEAGQSQRDITVDIAGAAGHALFKLSQDTGVAFQIHCEIEDRLLAPLESMLARYPGAKAIWCHLGMIRYPDRSTIYGPGYVNGLIEKFPNLHFDLASPPAQNVYKLSGARDGTLYDPSSGALRADWRNVLEKHSDRFLAASDYRPPVEQFYTRAIAAQRRLFDQLNRETREAVAFKNAWRLIAGTAWS
jgi:hypothetical protein